MEISGPVIWNLENAVKAFLDTGFKDGELVSHDWLAHALDLPANASREAQFVIMERVEQFKEALLVGHKIYLVSERGRGYKVVPPSDQCFVAATHAMREIQRQFRKCRKVLKHTRTELLNADEARRHTDTEVKVAALSRMMSREKRNVFGRFLEAQK